MRTDAILRVMLGCVPQAHYLSVANREVLAGAKKVKLKSAAGELVIPMTEGALPHPTQRCSRGGREHGVVRPTFAVQ
jgi:hypothetical protein